MKKTDYIINLAKNKALQSMCNYKVSAIGFNHKGEILCSSFNISRFVRKGGGLHAEMNIMRKHTKSVKTILIARVNHKGKFLPIHPCNACKNKADELNIKIVTINNLQ
jgi:cytidine deaminase